MDTVKMDTPVIRVALLIDIFEECFGFTTVKAIEDIRLRGGNLFQEVGAGSLLDEVFVSAFRVEVMFLLILVLTLYSCRCSSVHVMCCNTSLSKVSANKSVLFSLAAQFPTKVILCRCEILRC